MIFLKFLILVPFVVFTGCIGQKEDPYGLNEGLERYSDYGETMESLEDDYERQMSEKMVPVEEDLSESQRLNKSGF